MVWKDMSFFNKKGVHLSGGGLRNDNVCMLCEEYTSQALDYLSDNKTQTEILERLHKSCSHLPSFKQEVLFFSYSSYLFCRGH